MLANVFINSVIHIQATTYHTGYKVYSYIYVNWKYSKLLIIQISARQW